MFGRNRNNARSNRVRRFSSRPSGGIVFPSILPQRLDCALTAIAINPGAPEHTAHHIDAVKNVALGNDRRLDAQAGDRVSPRLAANKFSHRDVVGRALKRPASDKMHP